MKNLTKSIIEMLNQSENRPIESKKYSYLKLNNEYIIVINLDN